MSRPLQKQITSLQNPLLKSAIRKKERRERMRENCFGIEGARELDRAIREGFHIRQLWYCKNKMSDDARKILRQCTKKPGVLLAETDEKCMNKLLVRENGDGIFAVMESRQNAFADLIPPDFPPLILCLENIEKPGNIGAVLRSADGSGATGVILVSDDAKADVYHPHIIRNSLGTVFSVPVVAATADQTFDFLKKNNIATFATHLSEKSIPWHNADLKKAAAIFLGNEATGLSDTCALKCQKNILLPMLGIADSLNISAAATVIAYEATRQRCRTP